MNLSAFFNPQLHPTPQQSEALKMLDTFLKSSENTFVLKGFAGTGKTTIVAAMVNYLERSNRPYFLLAPTGKAAKVISKYSGKLATTIHKKIYRSQVYPGAFKFVLAPNNTKGGVFIVDEASMIGIKSVGLNDALIYDLYEYVYNGDHCKLIFVGDTAQLPPVGENDSPALNPQTLKNEFSESVDSIQLTQVVRQAQNSGILMNATLIREIIENKLVAYPQFNLKNYTDIQLITGMELQETIEQAYYEYGQENTVIIARSNKNALLYNQQIRNRILYFDTEITGGEQLMIVKNNYFYTKEYQNLGFLANGDTIEVMKVLNETELYGFKFLDVVAKLKDYDADPEIEMKIILESLYTEAPSLPKTQTDLLIQNIAQDYPELAAQKRQLWQKIKESPFFNAVQVKYAYAITGHKAQGGQWDCVFVDQSYFVEDMLTTDYLRWLYTAFTRAKKQLYLVNFKPQFFT